ncbi:MAG TPA: DUF2092 domain-containing protein [Caulobacteraceae bacterium]|nr:DUF2092 domain-containing protein [Caulobacteraceae bacterium]
MTKLRLAAAMGLSVLLLAFGVSPAIAAAAPAAAPAATPKAAPAKGAPGTAARRKGGRRGSQATTTAIVEPAALKALQRMGDYLSTLTTFTVQSETSLDLVTEDGQRIQLDGVANYKVRRPDGFVIQVNTAAAKRTYYYDGKSFTISAPELGYYATAPAPPTIVQTLDVLYDKFGVALPLEDLFRWSDPTLNRSDSLTSGFVVGASTIDGVATDQYAFREGDIDWQIWIQHDGDPLPRKLVIIDRTDPAYPAYTARLTWNVSPSLAAADFTFQPGKDDKPIRLTAAGQ